MTVIVKAKKAGTASFLFGSAAVRENDGLGTDILSGQSSVSISIVSDVKEPTAPAVKPVTTPPSVPEPAVLKESGSPLTISSLTYPNSDSWYSSREGVLSWKLPSDATAVKTLIDNNSYSVPTMQYIPPISSKSVGGLSDGVWYFHLRYLENNIWSQASHYKIQIDSAPPINFSVVPEKINDRVIGLNFSAEDTLSGIDYYNFSIGDGPAVKVLAENSKNLIPWPEIKGGSYQIAATVYDKAGNYTEFKTQITVNELATSATDLVSGGAEETGAERVNNLKKLWKIFELNIHPYFPSFSDFIKFIIILLLLYGWYKYIRIKVHALVAEKRAKKSSLALLLEEADKDLIILEKAKIKKSLGRKEGQVLDDLRQKVRNINIIIKHK